MGVINSFSEFYKCDLHIHTDFSNITKKNDYQTKFDLSKLISKITNDEHNIQLFSLTDHNIINYPVYEDYYANYNVNNRLLFVGVELDIVKEDFLFNYLCDSLNNNKKNHKKYHSIIIFKENGAKEFNSKLNNIYGCVSDDYNKKYGTSIDLNKKEIKHRITSFDRFVKEFNNENYLVISHGNKSSNIKNAYESYGVGIAEAQKMILLGFINSLELKPGKMDAISFFNKEFEKLLTSDFSAEKEVPYVIFSDNHDYNCYPKHDNNLNFNKKIYTWVKGDLSFETLRLAFVDPTSRIYVGEKEPNIPSVFFEEIRFDTLSAGGSKKSQNIKLSPGINVIIGGRSSGKSLLFNAILNTIITTKENNKISDYTKKDNAIIDEKTIKSKMNINKTFISDNNCNVQAFMQEEIIQQFSDNGIGLKDKLPFGKINSVELNTKLSTTNLLIDNLTNCYSVMYSKKDDYNLSVLIFDLLNQNKSVKEKYVYEGTLRKILKEIIKSNDITETIEKLDSELLNIGRIRNLKLGLKLLFDSEKDCVSINLYENLLKKKRNLLIVENRKSLIKEKYVKTLNVKLETISKKYKTYEDNKIIQSRTNIENALLKIKNYYHSKYKLKRILDLIENLNVYIEEKNILVSDNYKLNTKIEKTINSIFVANYLCDNISNYEENKSFLFNIYLLLEGKIKIKRYDNSDTSFAIVMNKLKIEISGIMNPKYSIVEVQKERIEVSSDNMSQGKKASIYLEILLEQCKNNNSIILLDQPEDNLDNKFITDVLIDKIRELRMKNQVILVTHNAAIAINSDCENVILAENSESVVTYSQGGIENITHRSNICKLLDGGNYIFDNRYHKYNITNHKIYEPLRKGEEYAIK